MPDGPHNNPLMPTNNNLMPGGPGLSPNIQDNFGPGNNNWAVASFHPTAALNNTNNNNQNNNNQNNGGMMQSVMFVGEAQKFHQIENQCKQRRQPYNDAEFPAKFSSLWGYGESKAYRRSDFERLAWARPKEMFKTEKFEVYGDISPNDILQGMLGDCYLLSAMAAIAENKDRIKRLFLKRVKSDYGCYCLALCINGQFEEIILDDQFPAQPVSKKAAFNSSAENELWVMLIEKAWAKIHGGYLNINAGLIREALHDLTGAPAITFFNDEGTEDERWRIIWDADEANYILCAGTEDLIGDGTDAQEKKTGIVGSHAYALIAAHTLVYQGGNWVLMNKSDGSRGQTTVRLLQMRNPWGKGEWKGAWSDKSSEWRKVSAQTKQQLGYKDADDGVFFIPMGDFSKYFSDFQVCYYHDNYQLSSFKIQTQKDEVLDFELTINRPGDYYFSLNQENKRFWKKTQQYKYSQCALIVVCKEHGSSKYKLVGSCSKKDKEYWFKASCKPGKYYASIFTPWESHSKTICFTTYGQEEIQARRLPKGSLRGEWVAEAIGTDAASDNTGWKDYAAQNYRDIAYKFVHGQTGLGYFAFKNNSRDTSLHCTVDLVQTNAIILQGEFAGQKKPQVVTEPGQIEVLWYRMGTGASINFRMSAQFKKGGKNNKIRR